MLTPPRAYIEEMLDSGYGTEDDIAANLLDLRRSNRLLGGTRPVLQGLFSRIDRGARIFSLLDIGTGSADIPCCVAERFNKESDGLLVVGLDLSERNLRIARDRLGIRSDVQLVAADGFQLPFCENAFDFITASQFLHHFKDDDVVRLLADFARVARKAVIVSDLIRSMVPYYFARVAGSLFATSILTRNDGPVSVLQAFTPADLGRLAERAGLRRHRIYRHFPYRVVMIADANQ